MLRPWLVRWNCVPRGFQSPLRRGIYCYKRGYHLHRSDPDRFNPLFVGASIVTPLGSREPLRGMRFQSPLRRGIYCYRGYRRLVPRWGLVSIPSSSGHLLLHTQILTVNEAVAGVSIPSSSGHLLLRGRERASVCKRCFNPLFVGASIVTG